MILILSNKLDLCVDFVIRNLRQRNERFVRLNTEDLPAHGVTIGSPNFEYILHDETGQRRLSEVRSVWFRRPGRLFEDCRQESRPSFPVLRFVQDQWDSVIEGLRSQQNVLWINDPAKNRDAECKISQLRIAVQIGLPIPRTCITSNKESAATFLRECDGRVVAKALYSPLIEYVEKDYFVFTSEATQLDEVTANELPDCTDDISGTLGTKD